MRNTFGRHESIFILLINDSFDSAEAQKAEYLQVNAVLDEDLTSTQTLQRVRGIITRYHQNVDVRRAARYLPSRNDNIRLVFTNPNTFLVTTGAVTDISTGGLRFRPQDKSIVDTIDDHTVVTMACLRIGELVLPVTLKVIRAAEHIAFEFVEITVEVEERIAAYLAKLSDTELAELEESPTDPQPRT